MSIINFLRKIFFLLLCGSLGSCASMLGEKELRLLSQIDICNIENMEGVLLKNLLKQNFHNINNCDKCYKLKISIKKSSKDIALKRTAIGNRKLLKLTVNVMLSRKSDNKTIYNNKISVCESYNIVSTEYYSNTLAKEYTSNILLEELADRITKEILQALLKESQINTK